MESFAEFMDEQKKKKKKQEENAKQTFAEFMAEHRKSNDIAPVKTKDEDKEPTWFDKGAFEDGYQFGDVTKTLLGTTGDLLTSAAGGVLEMGESFADAGAYLVGGAANLFGGTEFADKTKDWISKDLYDGKKLATTILGGNEDWSVLGDKSDSLAASGGQLLATMGLQAVGVPWFITTGVTSFGSEVDNAFDQEATYGEAGISGLVSAGAEILTEKLFGGSGLGEKGLINLDGLTKGISSKVVKTLADVGVDMASEGSEEVVSSFFNRLGSALYKEEKLVDILTSEEAFEDYLDSFIGGAVLGGVMNTGKSAKSIRTGRDYRTGLTENEQKVLDKVYNDRVAEAEKDGKKLTNKEKNKIYDKVVDDLKKGGIDTDTIESVLGGDTYRSYQETVNNEDAILKEYEELGNVQNPTLKQQSRFAELSSKVKEIENNSSRDQLKGKLSDKVFNQLTRQVGKRTQTDNYLLESYKERARRGKAFEADVSKYKGKQAEVVKKAMESGVLNNTRRTHEFVDMVAKISADKGVLFDFANNAKLKESGFAIDGATVNGYYDAKTKRIGVNVDSKKLLNTVVGHEVTHVLEGTELHAELQKAVKNYAETKGEYKSRYDALKELYKGVDGADIDAELTADLVGDYLFTDSDFVNSLSAKNRNLFQKIYDEIKYLCKVATAGSKEARELEKVKRAFDKAYRESGEAQKNTANNGGTKFSIVNLEDGKVYVEASRKVINGNTRAEQRKDITNFFSELLETKPSLDIHTIEGDVLTITKAETADKARDDYKTISGQKIKMSDEEFTVKMHVESHIDEVAEVSTKTGENKDTKGHSFAQDGFTYRRAYFKDFDGQYYEVTLSIGHNGEIATVYNVGKTKESVPPSAKILAVVGSKPLGKTLSKNSIPQNSEKSTENAKKSLSVEDEHPIRRGDLHISGDDVRFEAPVRDDIAPTRETIVETENINPDDEVEDIAPMPSDVSFDEIHRELEDTFKQSIIAEETGDTALAEQLSRRYIALHNQIPSAEKHRVESIYKSLLDGDRQIDGYSVSVNSDSVNGKASIRVRLPSGEIIRSTMGEGSYPTNEQLLYEATKIIAEEEGITPSETAPIKEPETIKRNDAKENSGALAEDQPITTAKERLSAKLSNSKTELENIQALRKKSNDSYSKMIESLQAEYDAKGNKDTKVANNILRRIERLQRLRSDVDADYAKRISDLEKRVKKMSSETYQTAVQRMSKMQEYTEQMENLVGDTSTWKDKKTGLGYEVNTLHRNLRDIVRDENGNRDIAKADRIYEELQGKYNQHEAELKRESARIKKVFADMKITNAESAYIQMLGELRSNPQTTLTGEAVKEYYEKHKNKIDTAKVDKAIDLAHKTFDTLLERVNTVLKEQGMREIPYRQGYFPHFVEPKQNFVQKLLNWKTQNNEIPTDIAGLTEEFNPERSWQSFNKGRQGDTTDYNFTKGLDNYVQGALDWIYHIEDIQKRRAFENYIRYTHSEKGVQERIDAIYSNEEYDADEAQTQIDLVLNEAKNPLNNFVVDFRTGTNILAGKKNSLDRVTEQQTGRKIYSTMTNIQNRLSANLVLANVRSALTNFIPITQSWAQVSPIRSIQAAKDTIANAFKDDGMINKSTFLTNRLRDPDNLYNTSWDKILDKAGIMFEIVDNFSSQVIWRSKYNQNIAKGMSEAQAIENADNFAENVMAGRSRGNEPTLFNAKSPLVKAFTMFQLEVNNQYGYFFKDVPQDLKAETNHWKFNYAKGLTTAFVGAYIYNDLLSQLTGSDAAFDPIGIIEDLLKDLGFLGDDEEKEPGEVVTNLTENIAEELPFVGGFLGGGRIPISSALPYSDEGFIGGIEAFSEDLSNGDFASVGKELMTPVLAVGLPVGGGQIKKTAQGLSMFSDEHPVSGSYTDRGDLRFHVEDTFKNRLQAGLFGQWANENARDYFENDLAPLPADEILIAKSAGGFDAYRTYSNELNAIEADKDSNGKTINGSRKKKVIDYINNLDISYGEKIILFKSEYNSDDTYNRKIIDYLNSRDDISYDEMKAILIELGFTVDSKGNIYWD